MDGLTVDEDLGMYIELASLVRSKERYCTLVWCYSKELLFGPCNDGVKTILEAALKLSNFDGRVTKRKVICI